MAKRHLELPSNEDKVLCGTKGGVDTTVEPKKVTCLTCKKMYKKNQKWYSNEKRKATIARKSRS